MDAVQAFLNSQTDVDIYMELPPNWKTIDQTVAKNAPDWVCVLLRALYGLKQVPRLWQKKLAHALNQLGFEPCLSDYGVYYNKKTGILIVTYVDDMLIFGKEMGQIKLLKEGLASIFSMEDIGAANYFLRVQIMRNR